MKFISLSLCMFAFMSATAAEQFAIIHRPGKNWKKVDTFKAEDSIPGHIRHYARMRSEGRIEQGGPFMDGAGGMMIAVEGETQEYLENFAKADPAVQSEILEVEVHPWRPAMKPAEVKYFFGKATFIATDGKTSTTDSLIKRVVSPIDETVVEYQATANEDHTKPGRQFLVRMKRIAGGSRFEVEEESGAFEGQIEMKGPDWNWTGWVYDIKVSNGMFLEGSAKISASGINTYKYLLKPNRNLHGHMRETLKPISEKEYLEHRLEILKY